MIDYQTHENDTREHDPSDLDLISRIGIALTSRQRFSWRVIRVIADRGVVTLQGIVPTYYDRQVIVAVTQHVAGVRRVEDKLTIASPSAAEIELNADAEVFEHGGIELPKESNVASYQKAFQKLPVLSPSLEEILALRGEHAALEG
jgi:hypothetical protein